jgi:hypothetical protein
MMTPLQLVLYYANLLILQYLQKPKAFATVETNVSQAILPQTSVQLLSFSGTPASGTFVLNYRPYGSARLPTVAINWNDSVSTIQTNLQAVAGLSLVTVTGAIGTGLTVTFTGVTPVVPLLTVTSNTLATSGAVTVTITATETETTLPLALANAFNINPALGPTAVGVQLDTVGKYAGVTRSGFGLIGQSITLGDADFLTLIQFATVFNSSGSSLAGIQNLLLSYFANEVYVFDYANMHMSYLVNSSIGSQDLVQLLITEGFLPKPMGVQLTVTTYAPVINKFFGFRTYLLPGFNVEPFNSYTSYNFTWPWLSYQNGIQTLIDMLTEAGDIIVQENSGLLYLG